MQRLQQYDVYELPVGDIHYDASFNCRGVFTIQSVKDLADSIDQNGLQFPVVVQPWENRYRLLAGHRRFKAVTVHLKWEMIPATVRPDLTEHQARLLNLTENLERKDLNMLEEAHAIRNLYPDGVSLRTAASELKRPTRWVHIRLRLLELPTAVQKQAAAGLLSAVNIEAIYKLSEDEQTKAVKAIISAKKQRQHKVKLDRKFQRKFQPRKTKEQLSKMVALLMNAGIQGLPPRLLTWAAGYLSDDEIKKDIRDHAPEYQLYCGGPSPFEWDGFDRQLTAEDDNS